MLIEWLHYLTTPVPWPSRRLGYLRESIALRSRSRRCRTAWAAHLSAARRAILDSCGDLPARRTAVVLGSGQLDDVPLRELAALFRTVVLVDAVHLWPARLRAARHRNVRLITADLSGTGAWLLDRRSEWSDPLPEMLGEGVDFVVSANLLSQLPILPIDRFEDRAEAVPPALGRRIVEAHLAGLNRAGSNGEGSNGAPARVCLITDVEQTTEDREGGVVERLDLLHGVALPRPDRTWELAPFGECGRHRRLRHRVHAYLDWHASARAEVHPAGTTRKAAPGRA